MSLGDITWQADAAGGWDHLVDPVAVARWARLMEQATADRAAHTTPTNSTAAREDQSRAANGPTPKPGRQDP